MSRLPSRFVSLAASIVVVGGMLLLLPACCCVRRGPAVAPEPSVAPARQAPPVPTEAETRVPTQAQMRNVAFHIGPTSVLFVHELRGSMRAKVSLQPVNFDDKTSFVMHLDHARIGVDAHTLDIVMNQYLFGYAGAPIRDIHTVIHRGQMTQYGIMHKVIDIPFTMTAVVSSTNDGRLRVHPVKLDICSLNGLALMKAFGMSMQKMLDLSKASGVVAEKNDLIIDVLKILPPPTIEATMTEARIEDDEMIQVFDSGSHPTDLVLPEKDTPNYMYYRGGTLRMGKLLMLDADMQVIDTDPSDPFDFFIDGYNQELVEGFSRNRPNYGLSVYMRDYADVGKPDRPGEIRAP